MTIIDHVSAILAAKPEGKVVFQDRLQVKLTPHHYAFEAWGAWLGPDGIWLLDGAGEWHGPLESGQANADLVAASLFQRLKAMDLLRA